MSDDIHNECTCNPKLHFHSDLLVDYDKYPMKYRDDIYSKNGVVYRCGNCGLSRNPPKLYDWAELKLSQSSYCICTTPSTYRCIRDGITCCYNCGNPLLFYHKTKRGYEQANIH